MWNPGSETVASTATPAREAVGDCDAALLERMAAGDTEALAPLMERHYRRLYRIALGYLRDPEDAQDAVQEAFVKACRHAGRWRREMQPAAWLTRILVNQSIDTYRRRRLRRSRMSSIEEGRHEADLRSGDASPERRAAGVEIGQRIGAAVHALPERQRAVFVLRHVESRSIDEIAVILSMKVGTVKSSLHRTIRSLRERLGGLQA